MRKAEKKKNNQHICPVLCISPALYSDQVVHDEVSVCVCVRGLTETH